MLYRMALLAQHTAFEGEGLRIPETISNDEAAATVGIMFFLFIIFWIGFCLVLSVVTMVIPFWIVCKKAGISPYLSLLLLVPGVNIAFYWILALVNWPNLKPEAERNAYNFFESGNQPPATTEQNETITPHNESDT